VQGVTVCKISNLPCNNNEGERKKTVMKSDEILTCMAQCMSRQVTLMSTDGVLRGAHAEGGCWVLGTFRAKHHEQ
jgi:hypothetical protein